MYMKKGHQFAWFLSITVSLHNFSYGSVWMTHPKIFIKNMCVFRRRVTEFILCTKLHCQMDIVKWKRIKAVVQNRKVGFM